MYGQLLRIAGEEQSRSGEQLKGQVLSFGEIDFSEDNEPSLNERTVCEVITAILKLLNDFWLVIIING